ncbi:hypothetical protein BB558_000516 [Smittium angustum]|uniref:Uncharacterized protein n=1 Tax=Smittium angustum TaxID=133377 RepID=A0A2U1JE10_SMIAN|nr:hypothetical protein BB558_000516 [Smittium angustum]
MSLTHKDSTAPQSAKLKSQTDNQKYSSIKQHLLLISQNFENEVEAINPDSYIKKYSFEDSLSSLIQKLNSKDEFFTFLSLLAQQFIKHSIHVDEKTGRIDHASSIILYGLKSYIELVHLHTPSLYFHPSIIQTLTLTYLTIDLSENILIYSESIKSTSNTTSSSLFPNLSQDFHLKQVINPNPLSESLRLFLPTPLNFADFVATSYSTSNSTTYEFIQNLVYIFGNYFYKLFSFVKELNAIDTHIAEESHKNINDAWILYSRFLLKLTELIPTQVLLEVTYFIENLELAKNCLESQEIKGNKNESNEPLFSLDFDTGKKIIIQTAQEISNNSDTGNIESKEIQKAINILELIKFSDEAIKEIHFLEGVHLLWSLSIPEFESINVISERIGSISGMKNTSTNAEFVSKNSSILPMEVRSAKSVPDVINNVLIKNSKSYKKPRIIREAARFLGYYSNSTDKQSQETKPGNHNTQATDKSSINISSSIAHVGKKLIGSTQWNRAASPDVRENKGKDMETLEEANIISLLISAALRNKDLETAHEFMYLLSGISKIKRKDNALLEEIWSRVLEFGMEKSLPTSKKQNIMQFLVQVCPESKLEESISKWKDSVNITSVHSDSPQTKPTDFPKQTDHLSCIDSWWDNPKNFQNPTNHEIVRLMVGFDRHGHTKIEHTENRELTPDSQTKESSNNITDKPDNITQSRDLESTNKIFAKNRKFNITKETIKTSDKAVIKEALSDLPLENETEAAVEEKADLIAEWFKYRFANDHPNEIIKKIKDLEKFILEILTRCSANFIKSVTLKLENGIEPALLQNPIFTLDTKTHSTKSTKNVSVCYNQSVSNDLDEYFELLKKLYSYCNEVEKSEQCDFWRNVLSLISKIPDRISGNFSRDDKNGLEINFGNYFTKIFKLKSSSDLSLDYDNFWKYFINTSTVFDYLNCVNNITLLSPIFSWQNINNLSNLDVATIKKKIIYFYTSHLKKYDEEVFISALSEFGLDLDTVDLRTYFIEELVVDGNCAKNLLSLQQRIKVLLHVLEDPSQNKISNEISLRVYENNTLKIKLEWIKLLYELSTLRDPLEFSLINYQKWICPFDTTQIQLENPNDTISNHSNSGIDTNASESIKWINSLKNQLENILPELIYENEPNYFIFAFLALIGKLNTSTDKFDLILEPSSLFIESIKKLSCIKDINEFRDKFIKFFSDISESAGFTFGYINENSNDSSEIERIINEQVKQTYYFLKDYFVNVIKNRTDIFNLEQRVIITESVLFMNWSILNNTNVDYLDSGLYINSIKTLQSYYFPKTKIIANNHQAIETFNELVVSAYSLFHGITTKTESSGQRSTKITKTDVVCLVEYLVILCLMDMNNPKSTLMRQTMDSDIKTTNLYSLLEMLCAEELFELSFELVLFISPMIKRQQEPIESPSDKTISRSISFSNNEFLEQSLSRFINQNGENSNVFFAFLSGMLALNSSFGDTTQSQGMIPESSFIDTGSFVQCITKYISSKSQTTENQEKLVKAMTCNKILMLTLGHTFSRKMGDDNETRKFISLLNEIKKYEWLDYTVIKSILQTCIDMVKEYGQSWDSQLVDCYYELLIHASMEDGYSKYTENRLLENYFLHVRLLGETFKGKSLGHLFSNLVLVFHKLGYSEISADYARLYYASKNVSEEQNPIGFDDLQLEDEHILNQLAIEYNFEPTVSDRNIQNILPENSKALEISYIPQDDEILDGEGWASDLDIDLNIDNDEVPNLDIKDGENIGLGLSLDEKTSFDYSLEDKIKDSGNNETKRSIDVKEDGGLEHAIPKEIETSYEENVASNSNIKPTLQKAFEYTTNDDIGKPKKASESAYKYNSSGERNDRGITSTIFAINQNESGSYSEFEGWNDFDLDLDLGEIKVSEEKHPSVGELLVEPETENKTKFVERNNLLNVNSSDGWDDLDVNLDLDGNDNDTNILSDQKFNVNSKQMDFELGTNSKRDIKSHVNMNNKFEDLQIMDASYEQDDLDGWDELDQDLLIDP